MTPTDDTPSNERDDALEQALRAGAEASPAADAALRRAVEAAVADGLVDVAWTSVDTPIGPLFVASTDAGVVRIDFGVEDRMLVDLAQRISPRVVEARARLDPVRRQLDEYFEGHRRTFDLPLDWRLSHGFRRTVLEHLYADVPFGRTVSYLELAAAAGNAKASRAVGSAMATNPIPIVVPCHRVLRTGGALGGYGGGLDAKRRLLALEGATLL
ncbi:MAG: methylated-DNA--[protein]-cysteine S-methyltransferase [Acidimicrobiales bacterium]|nr:methylated-DNA--[protein]-cysteine S-methyltransferase [Acidimicrobiales bacterium]